jgi:hypothetical protein
MNCLTLEDFLERNGSQIAEMQRVSDRYPDPNVPDACEDFTRQVRIVESALIETFGIAAELAKRSDGLEDVATIWERMKEFTGSAIESLSSLKARFPYCGTPELYDRALDYWAAASTRLSGVIQEIESQKKPLPKGLLPEPS